MTMDSYNHPPDSDHALDFTKPLKKDMEFPILDLSYKKDESPQALSCSLSPLSSEPRSVSPPSQPPSNDPPQHQTSFNDEQKSPFEVRSYMITPPSETESPKMPKYEPLYAHVAPMTPDITHRYPLLPMNLPLPAAVSPVMSPFLANQSGGTMKQIHMPVSNSDPPTMNRELSTPLVSPETLKKAPRPFKAYPKDPLALTMGPDIICDENSKKAYSEFRKRMLDSVRRTNEGTNIKMRRVSHSPGLPTSTMGILDDKNTAYWERRRKNNEAAKRSRDARRAKEDEIAIRAAFLEQENMKLKYEVVALRNETAKLRCIIYSN